MFFKRKQKEASGTKDASSLISNADSLTRPSCMNRIQNMKNIGFAPKCIFDCGASVGHWSWEIGKMFKGAQIVAIEPNEKVIGQTKELLSNLTPKPIIEACAVGAENGAAFLNIWDNEETKMSGSSIKEHVQGDPRDRIEIEVKTLDTLPLQNLEYKIDTRKKIKIINTSKFFLMKSPQYNGFGLRYDVISFSNNGSKIDHIENAFDGVM